MGETVLYLTRHGQTEWNLEKRMQGHKNSLLTELGVLQARWLGESLKSISFDAVYSSSSPRAVRTTEIIIGDRHANMVTLDRLREINMGEWEGQRDEDIAKHYPKEHFAFWNEPHRYQPVGSGETYDELKERVIPFIDEIITEHEGQHILIVTHCVTLKLIMAYYGNEPLEKIWHSSDLHPTSLCKISIRDRKPSILMYGDTSHYQE